MFAALQKGLRRRPSGTPNGNPPNILILSVLRSFGTASSPFLYGQLQTYVIVVSLINRADPKEPRRSESLVTG